jgi:hypothetical protein
MRVAMWTFDDRTCKIGPTFSVQIPREKESSGVQVLIYTDVVETRKSICFKVRKNPSNPNLASY